MNATQEFGIHCYPCRSNHAISGSQR